MTDAKINPIPCPECGAMPSLNQHMVFERMCGHDYPTHGVKETANVEDEPLSDKPISDDDLNAITEQAKKADDCYQMMEVHPQNILNMRSRIDATEKKLFDIANAIEEVGTNRISRWRVNRWYSMSDEELRLRCGEMTAQEIRSVRAILKVILEGGTVTPKEN